MATLTIRNLPEEVRERLRIRAAQRGRSMEAEVRSILTAVTLQEDQSRSSQGLQDWVDQLYGDERPENVADELIAERRDEAASE